MADTNRSVDSSCGGASEALSSLEPSSSSFASSEAGDSPRPVSNSGTAAGRLTHRVPSLALRANLAALPRGEPDCEVPSTARQLGVPEPAGPCVPAPSHHPSAVLRLPPLTFAAMPAPIQPQLSSMTAQPLSLDILSSAFNLEQRQLSSGTSQLTSDCAGRLGVPAERLRLYGLTELAGPELPTGCSRVAVEVLDSRFSLTALEELVAENQRLAQQVQQQSATDAQQLEALVQKLQLENAGLRHQLERSEALRHRGSLALRDLHQEFISLSQHLMLSSNQDLKQPLQDCEMPSIMGTPVAVEDGLLQNGGCDG